MNRALLLATALAVLLSASACRREAAVPAGPLDVVVITLDTTRADALGAYGQALPVTPRIDAMAADGTLFEQAESSIPSTFPSHATLFTGKQPYAHGARSNSGYRLSDANVTLAEVLRAGGWRTHAEVAAPVLARAKHLDQGFDEYRDPREARPVVDQLAELMRPGEALNTRNAEDVTQAALAFLRQRASQPFFLWVHYFDAHEPHDPPEPFRSRFADGYFAEIARIDAQVGLLLDEIEKLGLRDRTLVVLTADHGEGRGEHGERTHSFFLYDSTIHVPLVLWGAPVVPRGVRVHSLVRSVDVTPTLLDLLGQPPLPGVQGVSLRPLLEQPGADLGLVAYGESIEPKLAFGSPPLRYVREGRWKYVHKLHPELFDVAADPGETRNRVGDEPEVAARLRRRLREILAAAPPKPADAEAPVSPEEAAQLRALGYLAPAAAVSIDDELATLEPAGPDPADLTQDLELLEWGFGHLSSGDTAGAVSAFQTLWKRNPGSPFVLYGLTRSLVAAGRTDEAVPLLRTAIELQPGQPGHLLALARVLSDRGDGAEAEPLLRHALELDPCQSMARLRLSELLRTSGHQRERIAVLEAGDDACAESVVVRNALAWALATAPQAGLRDGPRALALAQAAVAETSGQHPGYLDTLAAARAETGDFEGAAADERRALALLEGRGVAPEVAADYRRHLAAIEARQPVREP